MSEKIGVFVCDCGTNVSDSVDTQALVEFSSKQAEVVAVKIHKLWCSEDGKEEMKKAIRDNKLTRVVVAACSPKVHEHTFQNVLSSAGLNPYLLTMANIREQVAWVTKDKVQATEKARAQLHAAIERVRHQVPLEQTEMECKNDFLVIGAGIAGMTAAITMAQKGRKIYLVEKDPWIGGKIVSYEEACPSMECAPCMLEPKMDEVIHDEKIKLLTNCDIENVKGFFGNFSVQLRAKARYVDIDKCIGCAACYDVCPVKVKNKYDGDLSERHAVYSKFAGALPNAPVIDKETCVRFTKGEDCRKCQESCGFAAIDYDQKDEVLTVEVGAIVAATGFGLYDLSPLKNFPVGSPNVLTSYQFERILSATGPTEGKVLKADGSPPQSLAIVHCAGSRDARYKEYCSGICCANSLKLAHMAKKKLDNKLQVFEIFSDWCLGGKGQQEFYNHFSHEEGLELIRVKNPNDVQVSPQGAQYALQCDGKTVTADMVILVPAMVPANDAKKLSALLGLDQDKDGFFAPEHDRIAPASSNIRGVYLAGCATGPKDIPQSVLQAQAAAGLALSSNVPGEKIELEVATSAVESDYCGGCRVCIPLCPYQAISRDEAKNVAVISEVLCKGCGVCVAACPSGAITNKHFTTDQIFAEIEGVLL